MKELIIEGSSLFSGSSLLVVKSKKSCSGYFLQMLGKSLGESISKVELGVDVGGDEHLILDKLLEKVELPIDMFGSGVV